VDPGPLLLVGFAWMVFSAIRRAGSKPPEARRPPRSPAPPRTPGPTRPGARPVPLPPASGADPTQREGERLEELLRNLGRTLDQASGPMGRAPDRRLPPAEEVEEAQSLEWLPQVRSLETPPNRPGRVIVDQDDGAEQLVARRIAEAEARSGPRTRADHQAFDRRIRQEPADKTAVRPPRTKQLRDAVLWREILGPPVALRRPDER